MSWLLGAAALAAVGADGSLETNHRVLVLLGAHGAPELKRQASILEKGQKSLEEREVTVFTEQNEKGPLHARFSHGSGFLLVLLGKDGGEKLRSRKPLPLSKLESTIDAMPMRQEERQKERKKQP